MGPVTESKLYYYVFAILGTRICHSFFVAPRSPA
jgi:hypothetical protein